METPLTTMHINKPHGKSRAAYLYPVLCKMGQSRDGCAQQRGILGLDNTVVEAPALGQMPAHVIINPALEILKLEKSGAIHGDEHR